MSSHKEAPGIANDAAADNTDVYAFVSPDKPDTVTLIANFVPLEDPAGGPNFYEFGDDVLYEIHIDNTGNGTPDITYQFTFDTRIRDENTFLYNTGPIEKLNSLNWNRRQFAKVTKVGGANPGVLGENLACPPCNIGNVSTPNYKAKLADKAIHKLDSGETVFTGQRAEGFYVDLGAIFDLGILRPFLAAHLAKMPSAPGINSTLAKNIHTIAIQVPKTDLTNDGKAPNRVGGKNSVIGVYASASRQATKMFNPDGTQTNMGPFVQISRQAGPLVNEVLISIDTKDKFNATAPVGDKQYLSHFAHPELAKLLPVLYPGVFPHLKAYTKERKDIEAIFLTGLPPGVVPGFQNAGDGTTLAELLRLNMAIPPTTKNPSNLGLIDGDAAGFPNGRRVFDDVTTIELRALAGATIRLVDKKYKPDAAAGAITPGLTKPGPGSKNTDVTARNTVHYLGVFPYLGTPHSGYRNPSNNNRASDLGAINQAPSCPVPVGAPQTGIAPPETSDTGLYVAGGVALAGAVAAGGVVTRSRMVAAGASTPAPEIRPRPRPRPAAATDDAERIADHGQ